MAVDVSSKIVIECPPDQVATDAANPDNAPTGGGYTPMTLRNRGYPAGFRRVMSPFVGNWAWGERRVNGRVDDI